MMYPTHGSWCNTRTFPTNCPTCNSSVFFFQCDHESRVFFDDLGPPWPVHRCLGSRVSAGSLAPRPSGKTAWTRLEGITFSARDPNHGLLQGMRRFKVDGEIIQRVKRTESLSRETMRIDPFDKQKESLIGVVSDVHYLPMTNNLGIDPDSVGATFIEQQLGDTDVKQVTILVDESDIDQDALDLMSYTAWCPKDVSSQLKKGTIVKAMAEATDFLGIGHRWVIKSLEILS